MRYYLILFIKGMGLGIANIIPGVSGGTMALITRIYEELIYSLKSFDNKALKLLISFDFKELIKHVNLYFLLIVFTGSIVSVFFTANLFKFLFTNYPILIWSFFFGLIAASTYFVGKRIKKWRSLNIIILIIGLSIAILLSFIPPANENNNLFFVFICGIIGISGMLLPGLSGSFLLILMGNYELLMVTALIELDYLLLSVFVAGSVVGFIGISHVIYWLLKRYKDAILALLTGFILGSLKMIWPWKETIKSMIINEEEKILKYDLYFPNIAEQDTLIAFTLIIAGIVVVWILENVEHKKTT